MPDAFDPYYEWLGIPPTEQPPDHYRLLGVERFESDADVISAGADRQIAFVRGFHKGARAGAAERLIGELSQARTCLISPATRVEYDAALRSRLSAGGAPERTMARPAPRSATTPPGGPPPAAGPPVSGVGPPGIGGAVPATGPAGTYPQPTQGWAAPHVAAAPGPPMGPPVGPPAGSTMGPASGPAMGYPMSGSAGPPQSAYVPPAPMPGPPASPPVGGPPISAPPPAPQIVVGGAPNIVTTSSETATPQDRDSTNGPQLWLLVAIVAVVIIGTGVAVAIVMSGKVAEHRDDGEKETPETESMTGTLVEQRPDGAFYFSATDAVIHGDSASPGLAAGREVITSWTAARDWVSWDFRVEQPAVFRVEVIYAAPSRFGGRFSVAIGSMKKEAAVRDTGGADVFAPHEVGFLTVRRAGRHRFELRVVEKPAGQLMNLRAVRLTPYDFDPAD